MKKKKIRHSETYPKSERPYYITKDNDNSRLRIIKISNFNSITEIIQDKKITKALVIDNYFDTDYMKKVKREAIPYPVSKELES